MPSIATTSRFFHLVSRRHKSSAAAASSAASFAEMADTLSGLRAAIQPLSSPQSIHRVWIQPASNSATDCAAIGGPAVDGSSTTANRQPIPQFRVNVISNVPWTAASNSRRLLHTEQKASDTLSATTTIATSTTAAKPVYEGIRPLHMNHNQQASPQFRVNVISNVPRNNYLSQRTKNQPQFRVNVLSEVPRSAYGTIQNLKASRRSNTPFSTKIDGSALHQAYQASPNASTSCSN